LKPVNYTSAPTHISAEHVTITMKPEQKDLVGVDVYLEWRDGTADQLGEVLKQTDGDGLELKAITNRGAKVWPQGMPETFCTDHWRCRFMAETPGGTVSHGQVIALLSRVAGAGFDFIKTENLYNFDGQARYSG